MSLLVGAFIIIKVLVGRLLFKPYKLAGHFETDYHDLENPSIFKDNCVALGYTFVALFTDYIFDLFRSEIAKRANDPLKNEEAQFKAKQKIF